MEGVRRALPRLPTRLNSRQIVREPDWAGDPRRRTFHGLPSDPAPLRGQLPDQFCGWSRVEALFFFFPFLFSACALVTRPSYIPIRSPPVVIQHHPTPSLPGSLIHRTNYAAKCATRKKITP
ncbi:hypothetical protein BO94DRAFT_118948 [Aspergillus sclerotioniger CBS 115572]|uniref:Uncharacterized protein n=1 Tax=Aspergillus sclerotioniger CBS 115572 TaxID=1450535 RepID=A0A317W9T4_9EURO|nr:hypothetical protein BO94DRAFT_118948 [Aspergillus sclerotioniger CBS 115572]PWY83123.1 hypothetical protein BO94DRAFT_118948 [Aspergillus sclerotioniger CBS 115572]